MNNSLNAQTVLNAVTGFPLAHTWSPQIHKIIYKTLDINAVMLAFPQKDIAPMIKAMCELPIRLLAVTMPHKQEVMNYLDVIDPVAQQIGAVNTVINRNGKLYGYNTDVIGIEHALQGTQLQSKNVLVLGAGGATFPLCWYLKKQEAKIFCYNRSQEKAVVLMKKFGGKVVTENEFGKTEMHVVVNATPVGMEPKIDETPYPEIFLHSGQTVFDFVYNPLETKLLKSAKDAGASVISGLNMLINQAIAQVKLWLGEEVKYQEIEREFLKQIES